MKEWFKKYLGLLGFGVWMIGTLIFIIAKFILNITLDSYIDDWILNYGGS